MGITWYGNIKLSDPEWGVIITLAERQFMQLHEFPSEDGGIWHHLLENELKYLDPGMKIQLHMGGTMEGVSCNHPVVEVFSFDPSASS